MKVTLIAFFLPLAAALLTLPAVANECAPITEAQVKKLFDRWNTSLATLNPDNVIKNYASDAVLLPTASNKLRLTQEERRDYFAKFLEKHPQSRINTRTIKLACNRAIDNGVYTFTHEDGTLIPARYTFIYEFRDDRWLIATHHSSAMPEKQDGS
ncbi:SgcJ/EcaC family oxidoreductase [Brucella anthropi]|uniref:SgcJ/EcaC family oxidoreductase n=1 Tax=Brucella anthropi TaxID=529 RepID=UPI00385083F2